jgi:hypothetical protein
LFNASKSKGKIKGFLSDEKNEHWDKKRGIGIDESESYMSNGKKGGQVIIDKVACPLFPTMLLLL